MVQHSKGIMPGVDNLPSTPNKHSYQLSDQRGAPWATLPQIRPAKLCVDRVTRERKGLELKVFFAKWVALGSTETEPVGVGDWGQKALTVTGINAKESVGFDLRTSDWSASTWRMPNQKRS